MKRSESHSGLKRSYSDSCASELHEDASTSAMMLSAQNKSLVKEMLSFKRELADARKELELMRLKSREMEGLVGAIQRGWSQLDIDASMLLDVLGDAEALTSVSQGSELLLRLLYAGSSLKLKDPTDLASIPQLNIDQWSSADDVEQERLRLQKELLSLCSGDGLSWVDNLGGDIDESIAQHTGFTLSLLERVCVGLSESGVFENIPEIVEAMINNKALQTERLLMRDRIAKLASEIIDLRAKLHICEQKKAKTEKSLDKSVTDIEILKEKVKSNALGESATNVTDATNDNTSHNLILPTAMQTEAENEYKKTIALLEKQLAESETAKSKVEMTLTERLARPLAQTEAQVADMRRAMDELRTQCKQRVAVLFSECTELQDKVSSLELAIEQIEAAAEIRCNQVAAAAEIVIKNCKEEKEMVFGELAAAKADLLMTSQLKSQLEELRSLETAARQDSVKLREKLKQMVSQQEQLDVQLARCHKREAELEAKLLHRNETAGDSQEVNLVIAQLKERVSDLEASLTSSKSTVNDLFLEIEAVANEDAKSREQSSRLVRQLREGQVMQEGVLEENLRLQHVAAEKERASSEMKSRVDAIDVILRQQDDLIHALRKADKSLRAELLATQKSSIGEDQQKYVDKQDLVEAQQSISMLQKSLSAEKKRNSELQNRCDDLTNGLEKERKLKMNAQRSKISKGSSSQSAIGDAAIGETSLNGDDATMLNMTLTMLRCSVCKDRFKDCAITRCFHLFCKECIDENLRNRHRKCPACGEKFGQDDVKSVYFTH